MILIHFSPLRALTILAPRLIFEENPHGRGVKPCYACRCATTSGTGSGTALCGTVCFRGISCQLVASAAACQPGRNGTDADAYPLPRYPPQLGTRRRALAAGGDAAVLCACRGRGGELCATAEGRWLAYLRGHCAEH